MKALCYCVKCWAERAGENNTETMCKGWQAFPLSSGPAAVQAKRASEDFTTQEPETASSSVPAYVTDDWVAAVYDGRWYIGKVIESDEDDVHINFMTQSSGSHLEDMFKWPQRKDDIWVSKKEVLCRLKSY